LFSKSSSASKIKLKLLCGTRLTKIFSNLSAPMIV
jgi:hypothetical protein